MGLLRFLFPLVSRCFFLFLFSVGVVVVCCILSFAGFRGRHVIILCYFSRLGEMGLALMARYQSAWRDEWIPLLHPLHCLASGNFNMEDLPSFVNMALELYQQLGCPVFQGFLGVSKIGIFWGFLGAVWEFGPFCARAYFCSLLRICSWAAVSWPFASSSSLFCGGWISQLVCVELRSSADLQKPHHNR